MNYDTLIVSEFQYYVQVTINRPQQRNSINAQLLKDFHHLLDREEENLNCRFIVVQGDQDFFCSGMDFEEMASTQNDADNKKKFSAEYMRLLKRFTLTPKIIISIVDGQVLAGGIGIVAASDIVLGTNRAIFGLSEILWGLLPACVLPFLIRRIGFQKSYQMTLTTQNIDIKEAHRINLVDEITEDSKESLRRIVLRLNRVTEQIIFDLKSYFRKMWIITKEMEEIAIDEISRLSDTETVRKNIYNYVNHRSFPWEKA